MLSRQRVRALDSALVFRLLVLAVTLLGFAARVYRLGAKSLWLDEGLSVNFAGHPLGELLQIMVAQDIHPPLSYVVLHFWMRLGGQTEFAGRFPALLSGTLLIPATYLLASALFGPNDSGRSHPPGPLPRGGRGELTATGRLAALLAALFVALSPFLVYYAQEARMYSDLALWTVLSSLALWKGLAASATPGAFTVPGINARGMDGGAINGQTARGFCPRFYLWLSSQGPKPRGASVLGLSPWFLAYGLFTALALYTQYFAGLVVAFQCLYVGLVWLTSTPFPVGKGARGMGVSLRGPLVGLVIAGALYAPWVPGALGQLRRLVATPDFWKGELSFSFIVEKVFTAFALGKSGVPTQSLPLIALAALLSAFGLLVVLRRVIRGRRADLFALLYLLVPLVALYAIAAHNPKFTERYLIMIAPVFYLVFARALVSLGEAGGMLRSVLVGRGPLSTRRPGRSPRRVDNGPRPTEGERAVHGRASIPPPFTAGTAASVQAGTMAPRPAGAVAEAAEPRPGVAVWLTRALALLLAVAALGASAGELRRVYSGPGYEKDDNRGAAAYIQAHEQPGDAVVLMMDTSYVFGYYYHGSLPFAGMHPGDSPDNAANRLNALLPGKKRVWLLLWQEDWADPARFARDDVDSRLTLLETHDFAGLKLRLYEIPQSDPPIHFTAQLDPKVSAPVNFDDKLAFLGYDPPTKPVVAGGSADLGLFWQAKQALDMDYVVSIRLVSDGFAYVRQDSRPAADTYPTTYWKVSRAVWGRLTLPIPVGTPPGDYDLELVVYPRETKADLSVLGADGRPIAPDAVIGKLTIGRPTTPPDPKALSVPRPTDVAFGGDLRLLGHDLADGAKVRPGASLDLGLYWQALGQTRGDDAPRISLVDSAGQTTTLADGRPVHGSYPTNAWASGEIVLDRYRLVVPATAAPGPAKVVLGVHGADGKPLSTPGGETATLATLDVGERPKLGERPADVQRPLDVQVGDFATLIGFTLPSGQVKPGAELALTLFWQAKGSSQAGYTVFTHLLDKDSKVWGQRDGVPGGGANPTTGWLAGEYVRDEYRVQVKPDAPPGQYVLEVGLYDPQTGQRVPVAGPSGVAQGDRIVLGTVEVR